MMHSGPLLLALSLVLGGPGCHTMDTGGMDLGTGRDLSGPDLLSMHDASQPVDAAPDLAPSGDASPGFSCGMATCSPGTEFCYRIEAGARAVVGTTWPAALDMGVVPGCNPLPSPCLPTPTCACLKGTIHSCPSLSLFCQQDHDAFTLICALP